MTEAAARGRDSLAELLPRLAISTSVGLAATFLMLVGRRQLWSWRLALFGALAGLAVHLTCMTLDKTVGAAIRRRRLLPDRVVAVPLYFVGGCAGNLAVIGLLRSLGLMPFDLGARDLRFALFVSGAVASVVGLLFYSFELLEQRLRESALRIQEQEFAEKELELARSIQRRLLAPEAIEGDGYRIAARNLAARFVAGDYYDVFRLADGALAVAVADVSGKGIGASLIVASVKAVLPFVAEGRGVAATLAELNRRLARELGEREFVALAFARFEPASGRLEIANAGLPDPYLLRPGRPTETLSVPGPRVPLGALPEIEYQAASWTVEPGERVLFLTDGLPEAKTGAGDPLGYDELIRLIRLLPASAETPGELLDRLFAAVREATSSTLDDDWTALVLEARASAPR